MVNKLPIVKLFLDAEQNTFDEESGVEKLYYADQRLREYRSVDGSEPWVVKEGEVGAPMAEIIARYEVKPDVTEFEISRKVWLRGQGST